MKKVFLMAMAAIAFIFAGCGDKKTTPSDNQADTTIVMDESADATADSLTSELDVQLAQNNSDAVQATLTSLQNKYAELVASGKLDTAKAYAAKIQQFLNENAEKIKAAAANNATIAALVTGIQNLPTTAEATAEQAEEAVKNNAKDMMKKAEHETNQAIDKAKREASKATDKANAQMNEAKDKAGMALDKSAEEANKKVNRDLCKTLPHPLSFLFLNTIGSPAVNIFGF